MNTHTGVSGAGSGGVVAGVAGPARTAGCRVGKVTAPVCESALVPFRGMLHLI